MSCTKGAGFISSILYQLAFVVVKISHASRACNVNWSKLCVHNRREQSYLANSVTNIVDRDWVCARDSVTKTAVLPKCYLVGQKYTVSLWPTVAGKIYIGPLLFFDGPRCAAVKIFLTGIFIFGIEKNLIFTFFHF